MMGIVENRFTLEASDFTGFLTAYISDLCYEPLVKTDGWSRGLVNGLVGFLNNLGFHENQIYSQALYRETTGRCFVRQDKPQEA